ncbi:MAG: hypothetical protein RL708_220 [Bacteroidota bacterium]|jgi:hypothetical protein
MEIQTNITKADRRRIIDDIKLSSIIAVGFTIILLCVLFIIPFFLIVFEIIQPKQGISSRSVYLVCLMAIPLIFIVAKNTLKYIDVLVGKKYVYKLNDYKIDSEEDILYWRTHAGKKRSVVLDEEIVALINQNQPLILEVSKFGKVLLFISYDTKNLLES